MAKIIDLKTEYTVNPMGIETQAPRFTWRYAAENALIQTSYRIFVASERQLLSAEKADKWDSGEVESAENINVEYRGEPLKSCELCYVKVICGTTCGNAESQVFTFESGLFEEDWNLSWRCLPYTANGAALAFRRNFVLQDKPIDRARAYVCCMGFHELYINGKKQSGGVLNPAVSDCGKLVYYNIYDITAAVKVHNGLGILAGNGWSGTPQVAAVVYVKYCDGSESFIRTNGYERTWKVKKSPVTANSLYDGETYDARAESELEGWSDYNSVCGLNDGWYYAVVKECDPRVRIRAQRIPSAEITDIFEPVESHIIDGKTIFDFGKIISGWCSFKVEGTRDAELSATFSETLFADGRINRKSMRNAKNVDRYILSGNGEESFRPRFTYRGFRYAEVTLTGDVKLTEIKAEAIRTATEQVGHFSCSDEYLNRLHEMAVNTEACNHLGVLTDCPQRDERMGWLNDLTGRVYQTVNNFGMELFFDKIEEDITLTANGDGAIKDVAPYFGLGNEIADPMCVSYLLIAKMAYERYHDKLMVEKYYGGMKHWTEFLLSKTQEGILSLGTYGDWVPAILLTPCKNPRLNAAFPIPLISSAYLFWHCKLMAEFSDTVGNASDAAFFIERAEITRAAVNNKYYDKNTASYCQNVQGMNAVALSLGIAEEGERQRILDAILIDLKARDYHLTCGNQSYRHLIEALAENGKNDVVLKILRTRSYPGWGYMLDNGATTVWERWEKDISATEENMHSYCHPMFGSYDYWFYEFFGGIKFGKGGTAIQDFVIEPLYVEGVNEMQCSIETLGGKVASAYAVKGGKIEYKVTVPSNSSALLILPKSAVNSCNRWVNLIGGSYTFYGDCPTGEAHKDD